MDFQAWGAIFAVWPMDWIIIGVFIAFVALDAMRSGSARAATFVLALPAALLIVNALPQSAVLGPLTKQFATPLAQLAVFAIVFVVLFIAIHRIIFTFSSGGGVVQAVIAGAAAAVVCVVVWLQIPALDFAWHFGDQVRLIFGEAYRFWWMLAAYLSLAAVRS